MNKRLESLLERIPTWSEEAQNDAVMALSDIEEKVPYLALVLTPEEQAKLAAMREDINQAIERGVMAEQPSFVHERLSGRRYPSGERPASFPTVRVPGTNDEGG